jgi:uncharacterized cupredoxin-like copper-binding protein
VVGAHRSPTPRGLWRALASAALTLAACGAGDDDGGASGGHADGHGGSSAETAAFGRPADVSSADRTIEVSTLDTFRFVPGQITVEAGETVAFEITNSEDLAHEFVLGTRSFQQEHAEEMRDMGGSAPPDEPFAIGIEPGETETLAWTFTEPGTVLYGCHVSGHYAAGMVGTIRVEGG